MILLDVLASHRQVIDTYPSGGDAYAVSIAAGMGALTSAFPAVGSLTVPTYLGILAVITLLNLRGLGDDLPAGRYAVLTAECSKALGRRRGHSAGESKHPAFRARMTALFNV